MAGAATGGGAVIDNIGLWYAARATGLVALLLLTVSVVWGVLSSTRTGPPGWPRFTVPLLHRNLSLLTLAFLAVHIGSSVIDRYAGIGWLDALLPFTSVYRPVWLGLGAVAFDLVLALLITSLLRPRINVRLWRAVHWSAYLCWPVALVHALGTGTDSRGGWPLIVTAGCFAAVAVAVVYRLTVFRSTA